MLTGEKTGPNFRKYDHVQKFQKNDGSVEHIANKYRQAPSLNAFKSHLNKFSKDHPFQFQTVCCLTDD